MCYTCRILTPASNEVMCLYMIGLKKKKGFNLTASYFHSCKITN